MRSFFGATLLGCGILIAGLSGLCTLLIFISAGLNDASSEELAYLPAAVIFALAPFVMGLGAFFAGRHLLRTSGSAGNDLDGPPPPVVTPPVVTPPADGV
jgi:hypothetical protein